MTNSSEKLLLDVKEAAGLLGIGRTNLYSLIKKGLIDTVQIGDRRLVPTNSVHEFVERLRKEKKIAFIKQR